MGWHIGSPEVVDREAVARKNAARRDDVCQSVFARRKRRNSATGKPPKPHLSIATSSMITKVESRGLFRTPSSSSLAPLMSAAFSSAVTESAPGLVPSRVTWIVTIGIVALPAKSARSAGGLLGPAPSPRLHVLK